MDKTPVDEEIFYRVQWLMEPKNKWFDHYGSDRHFTIEEAQKQLEHIERYSTRKQTLRIVRYTVTYTMEAIDGQ